MPKAQRSPAARLPQFPDPGVPLEPGEEITEFCRAEFATGVAPNVSGRRWFRDPAGHDIEPLLEQAGWPPRRVPKRPAGSRFPAWLYPVLEVLKGIYNIFAILIRIAAALAGGLDSDLTIGSAPARYMDRAIESDDFPVMLAVPGSVAGTVPWQLDPARAPENYAVLLIITTGRVLMTLVMTPPGRRPGTLDWFSGARQALWQVPRGQVTRAEPRRYSTGQDAILHFADGSWVRLRVNTLATDVEKALTSSAAAAT